MPRDIPVSNGKLLVCFDSAYRIRDLYFPHVGQENHLSGNESLFGIWVNEQFSWIHDDWKKNSGMNRIRWSRVSVFTMKKWGCF